MPCWATPVGRALVLAQALACTNSPRLRAEAHAAQPPAGGESAPPECAPVSGSPSARADAAALVGVFRLTLVASAGHRSGRSVGGQLQLALIGDTTGRPRRVATAYAKEILYGSASIALDSVGALAPGSIQSADPKRPGVLVIDWSHDSAGVSLREITLRFGAQANEGGPQPFDGTHMGLFVRAVSETGFSGNWDSGTPDVNARGHFCAERTAVP